MFKRAFLTSASVLMLYSILSSNPLHAAGTIAVFSGGKWVAVMSNGDVYETQQVPAGDCTGTLSWNLAHNIYALAGHGSGLLVGAVTSSGESPGFWAVDANGDLYADFSYPNFYGNVFSLAGRPAGQMALFSGMGSQWMNLVTADGDLYAFNQGCGTVRWLGALPTVPTAARRRSWGQLKLTYR